MHASVGCVYVGLQTRFTVQRHRLADDNPRVSLMGVPHIRARVSPLLPHLVMLPSAMRVVAGNRAPMRSTSSTRARPVRTCASLRNNATPERSPSAELSLHRRDMMMLATVGAALAVPQPPLAAAAGSEKAFVNMATTTIAETLTGEAPAKARGQGSWAGVCVCGV